MAGVGGLLPLWFALIAPTSSASKNDFAWNSSKACSVSDGALDLSVYSDPSTGDVTLFVRTNAQLEKVCGTCNSIEYLQIGVNGYPCSDCAQETLDACKLVSITGQNSGTSIGLDGCPLITSLDGFASLSGTLQGDISLYQNPKLTSATGLTGVKPTSPLGFAIEDNPQLACVPTSWPAKDAQGNTRVSA